MVDSDLRIRPYDSADAEAVVAVHEAAFRAAEIEFEPEAAIDQELQNVTETYLAGDDTFLVGTVTGDVVATGGYREQSDDVALVGHVRVHPDYQRRGYARTLMAELERRARGDGYERFVLETHEDLPAALELYDALGYEVIERVPHEVTGDEMIHLGKDL